MNTIYGNANDVRTLHPADFECAADIPPTPPKPVTAHHSRTRSPPRLHPSPRTASQPRKIRASQPPSPSPKERSRSLKKLPSREIVVLEDSSQLEVQEPRGKMEVKKGTLAVHESADEAGETDEEDEELDEWGMPPSGQKCGRA